MREVTDGNSSLFSVGKVFVHFLYQNRAFGAFDDFSDFVESVSCETSKSCQVRGSNPCRGATCLGVKRLSLLIHGETVKMRKHLVFSKGCYVSVIIGLHRKSVFERG